MFDAIIECSQLIDEAEQRGLWLFCSYQGLWFSPKELRSAQAYGQFRWSPVNFKMRDPREHQFELIKKIEEAQQNLANFEKRMES